MKRATFIAGAVCVACMLAGLGAATVRAASPVEVSLASCYFANGGQAMVPAGSEVAVHFGFSENTRGRVQDFLGAERTTADIYGSPIAGASSLWGPIQNTLGGYFSSWRASAGTLASPGDSVTVHVQITLARAVPAGKDPDTGRNLKTGPGPLLPGDFGCTITAT